MMTDHARKVTFNFTQSFKSTVKRYESLSDGKKADFSRSTKMMKPRSELAGKPVKVAS